MVISIPRPLKLALSGFLLTAIGLSFKVGQLSEASLHEPLPSIDSPEYQNEIARRTGLFGYRGPPLEGGGFAPSASGPRGDKYPPAFGGEGGFNAGITELRGMFAKIGREGDISQEPADLAEHGMSEWSYHGDHQPNAVIWALSTGDVQRVIQVANKYRIPVTPYSGGTSLEGHFSSPFGGISLDLSRMDKILKINEQDGDMIVQPGVGWQDLNKHLADKGIKLFFPLDPGPGATIGGMAATGCSGTNAVRYGTAKGEWFLNFTVVTPTGEVIKTRARARKSSAGWDTTKLFIGAEGTLGVVTEATIRLAPLLPTKCAVVNFPNVEAAVAASTEIVNAGYPVQCVEFLDSLMMTAINQAGISKTKYAEKDSLFFKFQGSDNSMKEVSKDVAKLVAKYGGKDWRMAKSDEEAAQLWEGRKTALWSAMALVPEAKCWTTDVCVPISKLPTLVAEVKADLDARGLKACHLGHVGDGNVHSLILFNGQEELEKTKAAVHEMVARAQALDGTCTGEHSVGMGKMEYLEAELGKGTVKLMETIKRTMDPNGIMNPGKIYPNFGTGPSPAKPHPAMQ